jgi:hypothetical protein
MKSNAYAPELDMSAGLTCNMATRQRECMRAFQTNCSWYQVYWYPEARRRRPGVVGLTFLRLTAFLTVVVACLDPTTARQ